MLRKIHLRNLLPVIAILISLPLFSQKDSLIVKEILKKAYYFEDHQQPDSELVYMHKAHTLAQKVGFKRGISTSLSMLGVLYYNKGDFSRSIHYYFKGLRYDEKNNDEVGAMRNASNLGIIFNQLGNYDKALFYYFKALKTSKRLNIERSMSIQYTNISIVYSSRGEQEMALFYQKMALEIDRKMNDDSFLVGDLINIGVSLNKLKRYDESLVYAFEGLEKAKKLNDQSLVATALNLLAEDYGDQGNVKLGDRYFKECIAIGREVGKPDLLRSFLEGASEFYESNDRHKEALAHYKEFIVLRDSIYSQNAAEEAVRSELNYEFDKKKAATQFRHAQRVLKLNARNKLQTQLGVFLGIVLFFVIVLLIFVRRAFVTKKRLAEFLAAEDHRKEILLQEVHHRINNNLQIISSLLSLQANAADDERLYEYLTQSQNRIQSLAVLHELMYDTNSPLEIDVKEYLNRILDFHRDVLRSTHNAVVLETQIQSVPLPTKIAVPLALVMNELVTNAIKYAFTDGHEGKVAVHFEPETSEPGVWKMTVSDTGKGLPPETENRKDSLGLKLVHLMARQLKGELSSENKGGAVFTLKFRLL